MKRGIIIFTLTLLAACVDGTPLDPSECDIGPDTLTVVPDSTSPSQDTLPATLCVRLVANTPHLAPRV